MCFSSYVASLTGRLVSLRVALSRRAPQLASRGNGRSESYQAVDHQYASLVDTLQKDLRRLGTVLTSLKRSSDAIGTARETDKIRSDLKQLTEEGRQLISTISTQLKTKFEDAVSAPSVDRTERNTRKLQQQKFVKDLQERVSAYQSVRRPRCAMSDKLVPRPFHSSHDS